MFFYCMKCANIRNVQAKSSVSVEIPDCEICGENMKPVPQEYLMANGSFFKSQSDRERLIAAIRSSDAYDADIASRAAEIRRCSEKKEQERITESNKKMEQDRFKLTCPSCGSHKIQKISVVGKYAKIGTLGILGADDLGKKWKCGVCGTKF